MKTWERLTIVGLCFVFGLVCVVLFFKYQISKLQTQQNSNPVSTSIPISTAKKTAGSFSLTEVSRHNSRLDCYMIISGKVYNVTSYVDSHPGGDTILNGCGKDATASFQSVGKHMSLRTQNPVSYTHLTLPTKRIV